MATKYEYLSTGNGYWVNNNGTKTQVITQAGIIKGDIQDTLAEGSVYVGNSSNITSELDASGDTKMLVGNGTTITSVAMSGDATMANTGAVTVAEGAVEATMVEALAAGEMVIGVDGTAANNITAVMSGDATMDATGAVTVDNSVAQSVTVALSAAEINGLYATPILVLAGIASKAIIVDSVVLSLTGTATQFAAGGVVGVQYDSTVNGAGTLVHADIAASVITGATSLEKTIRIPVDLSSVATAAIDNIGLYISNKTQAFTTGTGTANVTVNYHVV